MKSFDEILFESVLEYFVYEYGIYGVRKYQSPRFYSRRRDLTYTYFHRQTLELQNTSGLDNAQKDVVLKISKSLRDNSFDIQKYIIGYSQEYSFLFSTKGEPLIQDPEYMSQNIHLPGVMKLLKEDPANFYALQAYTIYYYSKGVLDLQQKFDLILDIDPDNPYIMARYARYLGSALYKQKKEKDYLLRAKALMEKALEVRGSEAESYFHSWLANVLLETGEYDTALSLYEKTIDINQKAGFLITDTFYWKALALYKLGKYLESLEVCHYIESEEKLNIDNDFRFFKLLANNYYALGDYENFGTNLKKTIGVFMNNYPLIVDYQYMQIDIPYSATPLVFADFFLNNKYTSFYKYNEDKITDKTDKMIFDLAFFYIQHLLGLKIIFRGSRDLEKLSFNYLILAYESNK